MEERKFHVGIKALILNDKNELLVLKTNPAELKGGKPVHWDLPGGRIKEGDSVEATLRKEVEEELGVDGSELEIMRPFDAVLTEMEIPVGDEKVGLVLFTYLCNLPKKDFRLSFEHVELRWAALEEAKKLLLFKFGKDFVDKLDSLK